MDIKEFIKGYKNHPVLFIGTGMSLRYYKDSYNWDALLKKISYDLKGNDEYYLDVKSSCEVNLKYRFDKIASIIEEEFNNSLIKDRNGKFKHINNIFYENMQKGVNISRFKIYISILLNNMEINKEMINELEQLKKVRKNIGSIITTNYDQLVEDVFGFNTLVGNNILLSNPYGSLYKIHGCITQADKIIVTEKDYIYFEKKFELIRAQLLSLFIHNPIIFLGYNIGDENIKNILKTIFTYVEPNSTEAEKVRKNFLLVEYDGGSDNTDVTEHDIDMEDYSTIRINKIKTDNYMIIYEALSLLELPVSAMDVRKVQSIVKEIYAGGDIKVSITDDLDELRNEDKLLAIGSIKTIKYTYQTSSEMMGNYFDIIDESNFQILELIDKYTIQNNQFFPIYGFSLINREIGKVEQLKKQQKRKLRDTKDNMRSICKKKHTDIDDINNDETIAASNKIQTILYNILESNISIETIERYLRNHIEKKTTNYRRLLCAYDFMKYKEKHENI